MVTVNQEDYLRGLYVLEEEKGTMTLTDLAQYLQVSKPSVSEMLKELQKEGFVSAPRYAKIQFTKKGKALAKKLTAKHRLIEFFLEKMLQINPRHVHEEAHRLEHAFSDESIGKLRNFLGNPLDDPHGKPIPY